MRNVWNEPPGRMSWDTFELIIQGIKQLNSIPSVFFGGFGEPLTHPRILEMVSSAKQAGCSVELITNGILLTPQICSAFIHVGVDRIWVSVDGATPQSYADVRLGDMLPRVLANLGELQKQLKKSGALAPRLGIAFVAMKRNIRDLPEVVELGKKLGADMFSISNVLPHTPEMLAEALYVGPHNGDVIVTEWSPLLSIPRIDINDLTKEPFLEAIKKAGSIAITRKDIRLGADVCPFVEKGSISIRWDGGVSPCLPLLHENDNFLDFRKRKSLAYIVDNINQHSLGDVWCSPGYAALRKRLQAFDFAYCTSCNGCDMANSNIEDCYGTPAPTCGACLWAQGLIQCP
jgi:MoaA/NifB/PqqE/SkfB family radical SAM enzyme